LRRQKRSLRRLLRVQIPLDERGAPHLYVLRDCWAGRFPPEVEAILPRIRLEHRVVILEGWLVLDYYFGSCCSCRRRYWG
jgi:hypothetical protein